MRVLFLDIDGVLNRFGDESGSHRTRERIFGCLIGLDAELVARYKAMLEQLGDITVVLSSSWRHYDDNVAHLVESGIKFDTMTGDDPKGFRGNEIQSFLDGRTDVVAYVILDDDRDFKPEQKLVKVDGRYGLTQENVAEVLQLLNV